MSDITIDRELFLSTLSGVVRHYDWTCHAYCLMANHYHLLIETPKANLSIGMRQLNGMYTQSYNRRHRRFGHLFQGRFKAILVEKKSHLVDLCCYIVLNPVRVKGGRKAQSWECNSYRATAGLASVPPFLSTGWTLEQFGKKRSQAQKQYRKFVKERSASSPWGELSGQTYLGSEAFIERHGARKKNLKRIPAAQTRAAKLSLNRIFAKSGRKAIAVAYEQGYRLHEIAAHLGVHYATVSRRLKQIEQSS